MRAKYVGLMVASLLVLTALLAPLANARSGHAARMRPGTVESSGPAGGEIPDPTPPDQVAANQVSEAILNVVSDEPGFGGLWLDRSGLTHVGVTPAAAPHFQSILGGLFDGKFVLIERSATYRDLEARRDRVTQMMPQLKAAGLDLLEWGPDEEHGTLWVSLRHYTPEKAESARRLLGDDVIVEQAMATGGASDLLSRTSDTWPYSAGIYLYRPPAVGGYPNCTSGMPIVINEHRYLVTAAHCYDPNLGGVFPEDVYNGGVKIGHSAWADFSQNGVDAAVVSAPGSFTLYRTSNTFVAIDSTPWTSAVGQTICAGGAFTGERCALPVIKVNYCASYYPNRITCHVSTAGKDGAEAAGHGDSGGPMYIVSPYSRISGIIVGAASAQYKCSTQGPVTETRLCSDYVRFQMATSILNHWNTTM